MKVSTSGNTTTPFGFAGGHGYQSDGDSGLALLGHRYYDASAGRFLSRDIARQGRNWYSYCENNPLEWVDPEGLWFWTAVGIAVGVTVGILIIGASGGTAVPVLVSIGVVGEFGAGGGAIGGAADGDTGMNVVNDMGSGAIAGGVGGFCPIFSAGELLQRVAQLVREIS